MRRTKAEAEQTRQTILDAALEVFSRQGYTATTLDDIARAADVTRGALYWHFAGGKPDIYQALLQERQAKAMSVIQETLMADLPPLTKLRQLLIRSLELLDTDPDYRAIIALLIRAEPEQKAAQGAAAKATGMRQLHITLADLVRGGIADGSVNPDVDPELAALAALGLLNGVILTWLLVPELFMPQAQAPLLVDLFLRSLARDEHTVLTRELDTRRGHAIG